MGKVRLTVFPVALALALLATPRAILLLGLAAAFALRLVLLAAGVLAVYLAGLA